MKKIFIGLLCVLLVMTMGCSSNQSSGGKLAIEAISEKQISVNIEGASVGDGGSSTIKVEEGELIESFFSFPDGGKVKMVVTPVGSDVDFSEHEFIGNGNGIDNVEPGEYTLTFEVLEEGDGTIEVVSHVKEVEMANPWTMLETLDEIEGAVGFAFEYPASLKEGCNAVGAMVAKEMGVAHVFYSEEVDGENYLKGVARKGIASKYDSEEMGPFSGLYTSTDPSEIAPGVLAYYEEGVIKAIEWQDGDYIYSLYHQDGLTEDEFLDLTGQTK